MVIAPELLERIVAHARRDFPNECCGMIAMTDGRAVGVHEAENIAASPLRFEVDGMEVHRTIESIEDAGGELGAIYHSHTRSEPYPVADRHQLRRRLARRGVADRRPVAQRRPESAPFASTTAA